MQWILMRTLEDGNGSKFTLLGRVRRDKGGEEEKEGLDEGESDREDGRSSQRDQETRKRKIRAARR